jgi:ATP-binding cassette subfamily F protein 3
LKRLALHKLIVCHQGRQDLFLGQYEEFLEKVGWEEEFEVSKTKDLLSERDEKKRKHEELMLMRAKIKPLESELRKIEKAIDELEQQQSAEDFLLAEASTLGQTQKILALTKSKSAREKEIEMHYARFMQITQELSNFKKHT